MDCNRTDAPGAAFSLWIVEAKPYGCILERNGDNTYFLAECTVRTGRWMTYFAPDPKDALRLIYERAKAWYKLFPLIRAAHAAAHPKYRKEPDLKYLERLITEAFHHFEPYNFISDKVDELREAQERHLNLPRAEVLDREAQARACHCGQICRRFHDLDVFALASYHLRLRMAKVEIAIKEVQQICLEIIGNVIFIEFLFENSSAKVFQIPLPRKSALNGDRKGQQQARLPDTAFAKSVTSPIENPMSC